MPGKINVNDPQFDAVRQLVGNRAAAAQQHALDLNAEIAAHDGSHSFGRHGYQTGWEAQLIRCCTQVTPDQPFDPSGTGATIRRWRVRQQAAYGFGFDDLLDVGVYLDAHGARTEGPLVFDSGPLAYQRKPGLVAGGFLGPEQQQEALAKARNAAAATAPYVAGMFVFSNRPLAPILLPLTSLCVVVGSDKAGFGYGFRRLAGRPWRPVTREQVLDLLNALSPAAGQPRKTWEQIFPGRTAAINKFHVKNAPATFGSPSELFDFLGVEPFWQKTARVIMRRTYDRTTKAYSAWALVTAFPDSVTLPNGVSYELTLDTRLTDHQKQMLKAKKLPVGGSGKEYWAWTGDVATGNLAHPNTLHWSTLPVPAWA